MDLDFGLLHSGKGMQAAATGKKFHNFNQMNQVKRSRYNLQWKPLFEDQTGKFWFCLFFLLLLDVLANPYAGIVHDARLYALQALSHLHPQRFARDLFFLHGSQDAFSLFSTIQARAIAVFGLHPGSWLLYVVSRLLLYGGALFFSRRLLHDNVLAFIACCLIAAGPVKYIFFEVNEPFLTPRLAAMGFSLFSLGLAYEKRNILSFFLLIAAGLLHPLMALGPGVILSIFWVSERRWSILACLALCLAAAFTAMLLLKPDAMKHLLVASRFDRKWLAVIRQRSTYLFPANWSREVWLRVGSAIGLVLLGLRSFDRQQRQFFLITTAVALLGIVFTVVDITGPQWILPFQLQPWRAFWVLQILSPAAACLVSRDLWRSDRFFHKLAGVLVAVPFLLAGGAAASTAPWLVLAAILICFPVAWEPSFSNGVQQFLIVVVLLVLVVLPLPMVAENLTVGAGCGSNWCRFFAVVAGLGPFFRLVALTGAVVFFVFANAKQSMLSILAVLALLVLLSVATSRPQFEYPEVSLAERNLVKPSRWRPAELASWRNKIPAGSLVLGDGSLPTEAIWFDLRASSYYSKMQGPGILFSRSLAAVYRKRNRQVSRFFRGDSGKKALSWCRARGIDFVISRAKLPLPVVGKLQGIRLYAVSKAAVISGGQGANAAVGGAGK